MEDLRKGALTAMHRVRAVDVHTSQPHPARMSIFDKCSSYILPRLAQAEGIYPYFTPVETSTATEVRVRGEWKIMVGSNNYLGLTHHPRVLDAQRRALDKYGSGATGSRFLNGTIDLHDELEQRFAKFYRKEAAVVFTTGYQASLGAVGTFVGRDDHLFLDKLDHASIVDGARLAIGEVHRYPHGDFESLARQLAAVPEGSGKLVVTDGVFSMEGSIADLPRLVAITREHGAALLVDDAHALGVLGVDTGASETPIIPVLIGDPFQAARFWRALFDLGVFAHPIVPPAVPANGSRIRVSMSAEHTDEQIEQVLDAFARVAKRVPVSWNGKGVAQGRS